MALTLGCLCSPVNPTKVRRPPHSGLSSRHVRPITPRTSNDGRVLRPVRSRDGGHDASPTEETRRGRPSSHAPIRAGRTNLGSRPPPLGRNEAVRPRDRARSRPLRQRPLNRETLSEQLAPLSPPQRTTNHPEQTIERSKHDSQTNPEKDDARIDDESLHHEAHGTSASMTTTMKPAPGPHTTRVIERPGKWNTIAKTHFQSDLSNLVGWYVAVSPRHAISHNVNTVLLQCALNLLNLLLIHTTNANATVNLTITVLNNFKLKRDTVQAKNDFPAQ